MKIVVIIVSYNGMQWYERCLNSLRNSTIPLDTVVIDNKSSDSTLDYICKNYPEVHVIASNENLGFGKANNLGFKYALEQNADYIFLLNQDAWIIPETIAKMISKMQVAPEFGILSPIHLNGSEQELDYNFSYYTIDQWCPGLVSDFIVKGGAKDEIYPIKFINAALWLISSKCLKDIGGFDPLFPHYGEDTNYVERLQYHGYKVGIYPYAFAVHDRIRNIGNPQSSDKIKNREIASILVDLTNLKESFLSCAIRSYFDYLTQSLLKNVFRFSFKGVLINIKVMFEILFLLPQINKNRNIAKKKGLNFL